MPTHTLISLHGHSTDLMDLRIARNGMSFVPGDCVSITNADGVSQPYSIASAPDDDALRFLVRRMPGGRVTPWLARCQPGDPIELSEPFGWFRPWPCGEASNRRVFLATGTGVAPFLSVLNAHPAATPVRMLYGVRQRRDAFDIDVLESRCDAFDLCVSREPGDHHLSGRITSHMQSIPIAPDIHYYLCGVDAMIDAVSAWLENQGVDFTHIHQEVFFNA